MRIAIIAIILIGCADWVEMSDYIEDTCDMDTNERYIFYLSNDFAEHHQQIIAESFDDVREIFGIDLQICGYVDGVGPDDLHVIARMYDNDLVGRERTIGLTDGHKIYLWPDRMKGPSHFESTVKHEIGHYLSGCGHSENKDDIMAQGWWGVTEYTDRDKEMIRENNDI